MCNNTTIHIPQDFGLESHFHFPIQEIVQTRTRSAYQTTKQISKFKPQKNKDRLLMATG